MWFGLRASSSFIKQLSFHNIEGLRVERMGGGSLEGLQVDRRGGEEGFSFEG